MSKLDPQEQREAALAAEWAHYCSAWHCAGAEEPPLDFESWKEKYYGREQF